MQWQYEMLTYVQNLLHNEDQHCTESAARNKYGAECSSTSNDAMQWCIGGAMERASQDLYNDQGGYHSLIKEMDDYIKRTTPRYVGKEYSHIDVNDIDGYYYTMVIIEEMLQGYKF